MAEEKKGYVKVTVDVELNPSLMELIKESMENMPHMIQIMAEAQKKKE